MRPPASRFVSIPPLAATLFLLGASPGTVHAQYAEPGATALFVVPGRQVGDLFGWRVRPLGDVDGDGRADFAVAAPFHNLNAGRVSVHSGRDGRELWFRDDAVTSAIHGFDLVTALDLDGDRVRDVLASSPFGAGTGGVVHAYSGRTGSSLHTFTRSGSVSFGYALAAGGDFDGDGVPDVAIGDPADATSRPDAGRVSIYSGTTRALTTTIDAPGAVAALGTALAFVGDTNGDGRADLAIGSRVTANGSAGTMHLFAWDGTMARERWSVSGVELGGGIDGNKFAGGADFDGDGVPDVIADEASPTDRARVFSGATGAVLSTFVGGAGDRTGGGAKLVPDLNGDGVADVLLGARLDGSQARWNGRVSVRSGRDSRRLRQVTATGADGVFGRDVDLLADVSGDGFPELLVGASGASGTVRSMGAVHVIVGDPCLASRLDYGAGLAGTLGLPTLAGRTDPILGASLWLDLGSSIATPTSAALAIGVTATATATPWGGTLLVTPLSVLALPLAAAGGSVSLLVPTAPFHCGHEVRLQLFVVDGGAPAGISESRGLRLRLGR